MATSPPRLGCFAAVLVRYDPTDDERGQANKLDQAGPCTRLGLRRHDVAQRPWAWGDGIVGSNINSQMPYKDMTDTDSQQKF